MTEKLLQYIWQFQYFNSSDLRTTELQPLQVLYRGEHNFNQGPDFLHARIKVGDTVWVGNIELHLNASEWKTHQHDADPNYKNLILHVVMNNDADLQLPFPTLELKHRVPGILLQKYQELMQNKAFIPCERQIGLVDLLTLTSWKDRMLAERLQQRSQRILQFLEQNNYHWEETLWWMLARNFGAKVNSSSFEKIARSIPLNIIIKHKEQLPQLEAILLGQAGLLEDEYTDPYPAQLKKEYQFLKKKYDLPPADAPVYFLRMRPANFPVIRLAQLAALLHKRTHYFSSLKEIRDTSVLKQWLTVTAGEYWDTHYLPGEPGIVKKKTIGNAMIQNILINTIVPIIFTYGQLHKIEQLKKRTWGWMNSITAENNSIIHGFRLLGMDIHTAADSQSFLQMKQAYCDQKLCLNCAIGNRILKEK